MTVFKPMVVPLVQENGEICTGQVILQPISLKSDRLLVGIDGGNCPEHSGPVSTIDAINKHWNGGEFRAVVRQL